LRLFTSSIAMAQTILNGCLNHPTAEGDNMDAFLFTSESVGEGHPGRGSGHDFFSNLN